MTERAPRVVRAIYKHVFACPKCYSTYFVESFHANRDNLTAWCAYGCKEIGVAVE